MENIVLNQQRAVILGTGSYVPSHMRTNDEVEATCGTSSAWISANLGIHERRIAASGELTSDMAVQAGRRALEAARVLPGEVDLVIVATATPDRLAPSTACIVHDKLGTRNAVAFDMNAVCSGFLFGLATAANYVVGMDYQRVLLIGADCFSRFTDWARRDAPFFGDGAGAAVLGPARGEEGFRCFKLGSDGSGRHSFTIPAGGSEIAAERVVEQASLRHFQMNAHDVYSTATRVLPLAIRQVLESCEMTVEDVHHFVPHQASMKVLKAVSTELALPEGRLRTNMTKYANTSSATIPILLDETMRSGVVNTSENLLFAAVGSGWTWGAAMYRT